MTLVIGFKSQKAVFITADTAITVEGEGPAPPISTTSFFEKSVNDPDRKVYESVLKIRTLNNRIAFAFSGSKYNAEAVFSEFRQLISGIERFSLPFLISVLQRSINVVLEPEERKSIQFIIGILIEDHPHLLSFNHSLNGIIQEHEEIAMIGNVNAGSTVLQSQLYLLNSIIEPSFDNPTIASILNSMYQLNGLHDYTLEKYGIGGAFITISVSADGIIWPEDTLYIVFSRISDLRFVELRVRDGIVFIRSFNRDRGPDSLILANVDSQEGVNRVLKEISELRDKNPVFYRFFIFLSSMNPIILVLRRSDPTKDSDYIRVPNGEYPYGYNFGKLDFLFKSTTKYKFYFIDDGDINTPWVVSPKE